VRAQATISPPFNVLLNFRDKFSRRDTPRFMRLQFRTIEREGWLQHIYCKNVTSFYGLNAPAIELAEAIGQAVPSAEKVHPKLV